MCQHKVTGIYSGTHAKCRTISTSAYVANRPLKNSIMEIEVCVWAHCAIYHWQLHLVFTLIFLEDTHQRAEGSELRLVLLPGAAGHPVGASESWTPPVQLRDTGWGTLTDTTGLCCLWPLGEGAHPPLFPKDCIPYVRAKQSQRRWQWNSWEVPFPPPIFVLCGYERRMLSTPVNLKK